MPDTSEIRELIASACRDRLPHGNGFDHDTGFFEAGLNSKAVAHVLTVLKEHGLDVSLLDFFKKPTVNLLAAELAERHG